MQEVLPKHYHQYHGHEAPKQEGSQGTTCDCFSESIKGLSYPLVERHCLDGNMYVGVCSAPHGGVHDSRSLSYDGALAAIEAWCIGGERQEIEYNDLKQLRTLTSKAMGGSILP